MLTLRIGVAELAGCLMHRFKLRFTVNRVVLRVVAVAAKRRCERPFYIYLRFEMTGSRVVHVTFGKCRTSCSRPSFLTSHCNAIDTAIEAVSTYECYSASIASDATLAEAAASAAVEEVAHAPNAPNTANVP